jgi:hypothetical protein
MRHQQALVFCRKDLDPIFAAFMIHAPHGIRRSAHDARPEFADGNSPSGCAYLPIEHALFQRCKEISNEGGLLKAQRRTFRHGTFWKK